jgi:hypothetical protein
MKEERMPDTNHHGNRGRKFCVISLLCLLSFVVTIPLAAEQGKKYGKLYLREYTAKGADEAAILDTLLQYERAFNSHDLKTLLSFFANDATYHPCGVDNKYAIGAKDCQNRIKVNFVSFGFETYYDPVISIKGNEAVVKLLLETGDYLADYTISLKKDDQSWLISACDYANDHLKP